MPPITGRSAWTDESARRLSTFLWNHRDGEVDRSSDIGEYEIDSRTHRPLNPRGRTGVSGRGVLGRWGPNHDTRIIITRWKMRSDLKGGTRPAVTAQNDPILEVALVKRSSVDEQHHINSKMAFTLPGTALPPLATIAHVGLTHVYVLSCGTLARPD